MEMALQFTGRSPDLRGSLDSRSSGVGAPWAQGGDKPPPLHFAINILASRPLLISPPVFVFPPTTVASRLVPLTLDRHTRSGKSRHRRAAVDASTLPHPPPITDVTEAMDRVARAVEDLPAPSMFQLADEGFATPFEQLIACIISTRTMEEVSLPVSRALFALARTPAAMADLPIDQIEEIIHQSTFAPRKATQIAAIARTVRDEYAGDLPCNQTVMEGFAGVGPKCANLALGIACDQPTIPVDIHVHRVVNRWGYVQTRTPEATLDALSENCPAATARPSTVCLCPLANTFALDPRPTALVARCSISAPKSASPAFGPEAQPFARTSTKCGPGHRPVKLQVVGQSEPRARRITFHESLGRLAVSLPPLTAASPRLCGTTAFGLLAVLPALRSACSRTRCSTTL